MVGINVSPLSSNLTVACVMLKDERLAVNCEQLKMPVLQGRQLISLND